MNKPFEDFQAIGKDSFETYIASAQALAKGFQTLAVEGAEFFKKSFEHGSRAFENAAQAKSFEKAVEVQQAYAKDAYEAFVSQAGKVGEMYLSVAKDAYKPFETKLAQGMNIAK